MNSLATLGHSTVTVVDEVLPEKRKKMGWSVPALKTNCIYVSPTQAQIDALINAEPETTVHVFGSALRFAWGQYAIKKASVSRAKIGIMSESYDPDGIKGAIRKLKSKMFYMRFGSNVDFILGMGDLGVSWYVKSGFNPRVVFPFGYSVDLPWSTQGIRDAGQHSQSGLEVICIGSLTKTKRIDILLRALAQMHKGQVHLTIIGDGPERASLHRLSIALGLDTAVSWLGVVPHESIPNVFEGADVLALPSRFDGWGVVINESLMTGTPVICTDHCGGAVLLNEPCRGGVVRRNQIDDLSAMVSGILEHGITAGANRLRIREWSKCLSGDSMAQYLLSVLDHIYLAKDLPTAPWLRLQCDDKAMLTQGGAM